MPVLDFTLYITVRTYNVTQSHFATLTEWPQAANVIIIHIDFPL